MLANKVFPCELLMNIKPDALRTFVMVANSGSLAEASKQLNRTPSAISMALKQFEEQLGAPLFETDRKSTLTALGRFTLEEGQRALSDFDESARTIQRYINGETGTVRLATVPSLATRLLPQVIQQLHSITPNVRLELRDLDSALIATAVRSGHVDFGIASRVAGSHDLQAELLLEEPFGVVCCSDHRFVGQNDSIDWNDLKGERLISNGLTTTIDNPKCRQLISDSAMHIHNTATLLSFVQQGIGITLLPRMAVAESSGLCFVPLADKHLLRGLYFLQHRQHHLNPAALQLKNAIRNYVGQHPFGN